MIKNTRQIARNPITKRQECLEMMFEQFWKLGSTKMVKNSSFKILCTFEPNRLQNCPYFSGWTPLCGFLSITTYDSRIMRVWSNSAKNDIFVQNCSPSSWQIFSWFLFVTHREIRPYDFTVLDFWFSSHFSFYLILTKKFITFGGCRFMIFSQKTGFIKNIIFFKHLRQ